MRQGWYLLASSMFLLAAYAGTLIVACDHPYLQIDWLMALFDAVGLLEHVVDFVSVGPDPSTI